jgi:RNA polymerase sigma factor (sigma-70 family)
VSDQGERRGVAPGGAPPGEVSSTGDSLRDNEFLEFYDQNEAELMRHIRGMIASDSGVEDLAQDSFLAVRQYWEKIDPARRRGYLYRVARNNVYRFWKTRNRVEPRDGTDSSFDRPDPVSLRDVEEAGERRDYEEVRKALAALPPREREAVLLRHYVGFSVSETAFVMGVGEGAVKRYCSDGLTKLRRLLGDSGDTGTEGSR